MSSNNKIHKKSYLTAKLTIFDWGWPDKIIFGLKGKQNEKGKGMLMIDRLKDLFGISNSDITTHEEESIQKEVKKMEKIKWTRDDKGNIISPYRSKKELKW